MQYTLQSLLLFLIVVPAKIYINIKVSKILVP